MIQFGSVTADNFQGLQNIATIVQHSIGVSTVNVFNFRMPYYFVVINLNPNRGQTVGYFVKKMQNSEDPDQTAPGRP